MKKLGILLSFFLANMAINAQEMNHKPGCDFGDFNELNIHKVQNEPIKDVILLQNIFWCGMPSTTNSFFLSMPDKNRLPFGSSTSFGENSFSADYTPQCGLDCFVSMEGTYKLLENNKIEFIFESIERNGFCPENEAVENQKNKITTVVFQMISKENGIHFELIK